MTGSNMPGTLPFSVSSWRLLLGLSLLIAGVLGMHTVGSALPSLASTPVVPSPTSAVQVLQDPSGIPQPAQQMASLLTGASDIGEALGCEAPCGSTHSLGLASCGLATVANNISLLFMPQLFRSNGGMLLRGPLSLLLRHKAQLAPPSLVLLSISRT